jgi:tripartite-type tricarboxylate transporter receptor subunit TctC
VGIKFDGKGSSEAISGIAAPRGVPDDVLKKYENVLKEAVNSEDFLQACRSLWLDPDFQTGELFRKEVVDSYSFIEDLSQKPGFK